MAVCRLSSPHRRRRPEHHRHEPDPEAGDHVHGEGREEGDPQRAHGGGAHALGGRRHLAAPLLLAPEGAQGRQSLDQLEEAARQRAEPAPLALRALRRLAPEVDHREGHREHQRDHHHERQPVLGGDPREQQDGDHGGGRGLGEVAREVGVERAQPACRGEGELARALPGQPARPERQGVAQQLAAQPGRRRGRRRRGPRGRPAPCRTARATMASPTTTMAGTTSPSGAWCSSERSTTYGERDGLHDDEGGAHRADGERDARDPPQAGDPGRQLGVDQAGPARARGWCAHRLNVVSFTSTARPMRPSATARRAVCASSQVAAVRTPSGRSATMAVRTGSSPSAPP